VARRKGSWGREASIQTSRKGVENNARGNVERSSKTRVGRKSARCEVRERKVERKRRGVGAAAKQSHGPAKVSLGKRGRYWGRGVDQKPTNEEGKSEGTPGKTGIGWKKKG